MHSQPIQPLEAMQAEIDRLKKLLSDNEYTKRQLKNLLHNWRECELITQTDHTNANEIVDRIN